MTDNDSDSDSDRAVAARAAPRLDPQDNPRSWLPQLVAGWREAAADLVFRWKKVGRGGTIVADLLAGLTVAAVALPLNVALARASGMPASAGLIAGAVGGAVAAILGGASLQVTGPAAALSVMVLAIAQKYGPTGVAAATLIIGVVQLLLFLMLAGRAAKLVPDGTPCVAQDCLASGVCVTGACICAGAPDLGVAVGMEQGGPPPPSDGCALPAAPVTSGAPLTLLVLAGFARALRRRR